MQTEDFVSQRLDFVTLSKHFEKPHIKVIGAKDVGRNAVVSRQRANEFREDVAGDPARQIGIELFIKMLDLVPQVSVLQWAVVGDVERGPELTRAGLVAMPYRPENRAAACKVMF
jgi:hypothetical protein